MNGHIVSMLDVYTEFYSIPLVVQEQKGGVVSLRVTMQSAPLPMLSLAAHVANMQFRNSPYDDLMELGVYGLLSVKNKAVIPSILTHDIDTSVDIMFTTDRSKFTCDLPTHVLINNLYKYINRVICAYNGDKYRFQFEPLSVVSEW